MAALVGTVIGSLAKGVLVGAAAHFTEIGMKKAVDAQGAWTDKLLFGDDEAAHDKARAKFKEIWNRSLLEDFRDLFAGGTKPTAVGADIGKSLANAAQKGAQSADLSGAGQAVMTNYAGAIQAAEGQVVAAVQALVSKLKSMLEFTASPTIQPRLAPAAGGAGAPAAPAPKKQSRATPANSVHIAQAHFHGVQDVDGLHRQVMARLDREAAAGSNLALHDIDVGGVG